VDRVEEVICIVGVTAKNSTAPSSGGLKWRLAFIVW